MHSANSRASMLPGSKQPQPPPPPTSRKLRALAENVTQLLNTEQIAVSLQDITSPTRQTVLYVLRALLCCQNANIHSTPSPKDYSAVLRGLRSLGFELSFADMARPDPTKFVQLVHNILQLKKDMKELVDVEERNQNARKEVKTLKEHLQMMERERSARDSSADVLKQNNSATTARICERNQESSRAQIICLGWKEKYENAALDVGVCEQRLLDAQSKERTMKEQLKEIFETRQHMDDLNFLNKHLSEQQAELIEAHDRLSRRQGATEHLESCKQLVLQVAKEREAFKQKKEEKRALENKLQEMNIAVDREIEALQAEMLNRNVEADNNAKRRVYEMESKLQQIEDERRAMIESFEARRAEMQRKVATLQCAVAQYYEQFQ